MHRDAGDLGLQPHAGHDERKHRGARLRERRARVGRGNVPVEGAPRIGTVSIGAASVPLIGIQVDPARFEDPRCPFFPDSVLK